MPHRFASDERLVTRVRAGSAGAFDAIFDRHHRPLLAFCRSMLGSAADAEDAVQHTFMAAYADLMRSDKPILLRPWLYSIARHRCLTMLRARRERPVAELPEPGVGHLEFEAREELRATFADIAHLPEDQRAALVLAELGDVSHAEIAQVLGCRHEKVKALVFQARSTLATGRTAREVPCADVREQLAAGGLAIRRTFLRKHVRECAGCREFGEQLRLQRRRLRILLPVAPALGLKRLLLGAVLSTGGGATAGGLAVTALVTVTIAGGGGAPATAASTTDPPARAAAKPAVKPAATARRARAARSAPAPIVRRRSSASHRAQRPSAVDAPLHASTRTEAPVRAPEPAAAPEEPAREAPDASPSPPPAQEAAENRRPAEPPGQAKRPDPPAEPPGGGPPAEPPGGGRPDAPPGNPHPGPPPGNPHPGPPADPPGKPAGPPPPAGDPGAARPRR
jgi:RNA polymerase sigma factor (sigma-70 family)